MDAVDRQIIIARLKRLNRDELESVVWQTFGALEYQVSKKPRACLGEAFIILAGILSGIESARGPAALVVDWQPIATAPRDGRTILMRCAQRPELTPVKAGWADGAWEQRETPRATWWDDIEHVTYEWKPIAA